MLQHLNPPLLPLGNQVQIIVQAGIFLRQHSAQDLCWKAFFFFFNHNLVATVVGCQKGH